MNIILVSNENQIKYSLSKKFFPLGINIFHFNKCSNAITGVNDINPAVIIVDTDTEPRAWKPLITVIRSNNKERKIIFLLIMSSCDLETANQALYLGVNGIILKPFTENKSIVKIIQLIKRHAEIEKLRNYIRIKPGIEDSMLFIYNDMEKRRILKGQVTDISANGLSVNINSPFNEDDFAKGIKVENCLLKIKGFEVHFDFFVLWYKPPVIGGKFINVGQKEFIPLYNYILDKLSDVYQISGQTYKAGKNIIEKDQKENKVLEDGLEELKSISEDSVWENFEEESIK